jgi:putative ABC transport system permease protein
MIKMIWVISVRNMLKHKVYTLINVFGLALGFTAFILIGLFIRYEFSWDKTNIGYDRIYRIQRHDPRTVHAMDGNDISPHTRAITAQLLEKQFPEFEKVTVVHDNGGKFLATVPEKQIYEDKGIHADSCFFEVFTYNFIEGTQKDALTDPFSIVLSKTMADKLFDGKKALGETVIYEKKYALKVKGVYHDLPENNSIRPEYIISFSTLANTGGIKRNNISSGDCMTFALLTNGADYKNTENKIKTVFSGFRGIENEQLILCPMKNIYLNFNGRNDYIIALALYGLIGLFILIMSAFNYINLTTANASIRGKEVALKKVCGSTRFALVAQFLSETVIISFIALIIAFEIAQIFLPVFSGVVGRALSLSFIGDFKFVMLAFLISLVVGLLSGIYPALVMSSRKILSLFKGEMPVKGRQKWSLKNVLVCIQFAISVLLILVTLSFSLQIKFMFRKNPGFEKENILYTSMSVTNKEITFEQLRNRLLQHPEILNGSMSSNFPFVNLGGGNTNWEGGDPAEKIQCRFNTVSYDFVKNLGVPMVAGRDFSQEFKGDIGKSCLINETAARSFGWDNPIGKKIKDNSLTIVGVVKNYIFKDMHNGIEPAILILSPEKTTGDWIFAFRVDPRNEKKAKSILSEEFASVFPEDPFEFNNLATTYAEMDTFKVYNSINRTILFFSVFNIFLAMVGLFGLVSFTVVRRTKEIGIRKINGSTSMNIFYILSREYYLLLLPALIIAIPLALRIYARIPGANKLPAQPWVFVLGVIILLVIILITTSFQTIKASRRNPVEALRYE